MKLKESDKSFLNLLTTTSSEQSVQIIKSANNLQLQLLVEIVYNCLKSVIPLSERIKRRLSTFAKAIRAIVAINITPQLRRRRLLRIITIIPTLIASFFKYYESGASVSAKGKI